MKCRNCNKEIGEDIMFCKECGTAVSQKNDGSGNQLNLKNKIKLILFAVTAVLAVALIVFAIFKFKMDDSTKIESTTQTFQTDITEETNDSRVFELKTEYAKIAGEILSLPVSYEGLEIQCYVFNETESRFPVFAYSTGLDIYTSPFSVYCFDGEKITEINPPSAGSGGTAKDQFYFIKDTNVMVYRSFGNSEGTFSGSEQVIYNGFKDGSIIIESQSYEYETDSNADLNENIANAQKAMCAQMDEDLTKYVGDSYELVLYQDVMVTENCEEYLEKEFGEDIIITAIQAD